MEKARWGDLEERAGKERWTQKRLTTSQGDKTRSTNIEYLAASTYSCHKARFHERQIYRGPTTILFLYEYKVLVF